MNERPHQHCPDQEVLQELAAGIGSPELVRQTMQHVARCSACGAELRRYVREFSEEQSPEDAALVRQLQSSKPQWQKRLVRELLGGRKRFPWLKLVPAAAALALAVLAVVQVPAFLAEYKLKQAQKQAAAAFVERRTTEMRLTSVDYAEYKPFPIVLGAENGRGLDEVPTSLHDASGAANKNLLASNADPRWLQIQGRALLWESTPSSLEKAEKDFEKARSSGLTDPSLEIDLAASYFERDSKAEHPNLQRTLNLLSEVLSQPKLSNGDRATALYDLAIAYEKTQAWDLAVSTWEKYLQADSSSGWANAAQKHLKDAQARIHNNAFVNPSEPGVFLQQVSKLALQDRLEEYQDVAVGKWLPDALATRDPLALDAARSLGDLLLKQHSDPWLADLVSSLRQEDLPAVSALAIALKKNGEGDHAGAVEQALIAAKTFARQKNLPGEFRARLEEVNAFRRAFSGSDCLARADPLWNRLLKTDYHWLQAWLALEKAECGNLLGEFAESNDGLQVSRQIAGQFGFSQLVLRAVGISAGNKHLRGNCDESWKESVDGLNVYWQNASAPASRLYQFYSVMYQCALETGSLRAGEALLRHAIELRESGPDIKKNQIIEATLHLQLANLLDALGQNLEAEKENRKATTLLDRKKLPPQFDLIVKLEPAEFQLEHGDARLALAALDPLRSALADSSDKFFFLRFNQALGNTYYKLRQLDDAGAAYQNAITTAESALGALNNWAERLQWLRATDESYRGLIRVLIDQKKTNEALERWELYRSRPMLQAQFAEDMNASALPRSKGPQGHASLSSTKSASETRVVYASFNDGLYIWVSREGNVTGQWIGIGKQDFENMAREFVAKCAVEESNLQELNELGKKLFAVLLQPVISHISPAQTVIIELDRMAYNLPMEALRAPEGWYFGEKYSVVYSPGVWVEKELRLPERVNGRESMLVLDASRALGAGYLPGFEAQKNTIERLFPKTTIIDPTKIRWSEMKARLAATQIFHYMGHGRPDGSGTSLDYDGKQSLRAKDFGPKMLERSQIVLLAACSGATGRENGLADTNNLVRAFLSAGVPSVIASHWNVDSASTSQLMVSFYQHLAKSESVAQAMYNARIEVLRTKAHPYFWAGFTLAGRAS